MEREPPHNHREVKKKGLDKMADTLTPADSIDIKQEARKEFKVMQGEM